MVEEKEKKEVVREGFGGPQDTNKNGTAGAPSKYKPEYCERMLRYFEEGGRKKVYKPFHFRGYVKDHYLGKLPAYFEAFAAEIGVTHGTLLNWTKAHEEFLEIYQRCKDIQLAHIQEGVMAGVYNSGGTIFILKNQHNWAEKQEVSGPGGGPIQGQNVERGAQVAEWMDKLDSETREKVRNAAEQCAADEG